MKIVLINNLYKPFQRGGAESVVEMQKDIFESLGHDVLIVSLCPKGKAVTDKEKNVYLESSFFELSEMSMPQRFFWHLWDLFDVFLAKKIMKVLAAFEPDLVLTHNTSGMSRLLIPYISEKYHHWHYLHDINLLHPSGLMFLGKESVLDTLQAKVYQMILAAYCAKIDAVISPSSWLLDLHIKKGFFVGTRRREVLETPQRSTEAKVKEKEKDGFTFLFVGLISEHKGIEVLLDAWQEFKDRKQDNTRLLLAGEMLDQHFGSEIEKFTDLEFLGKQDKGRIDALYETSDCLIVPSLCYENSPTVMYEAAAKSLCILSTDHGGAGELAKKIDAVTFAAGDAGSLLEAMIWARDNKHATKKIGEHSRFLASDFNYENYKKRIGYLMRTIS